MTLTLLDWRRRVAALWTAARSSADPEAGWRTWRDGRDELFAQPPRLTAGRGGAGDLHRPPLRRLRPGAALRAPPGAARTPAHLDVPTAADGVIALDRIGTVALGDLGRIDVWWIGGYGGGVFLPLRDGSAGRTTYGGGRYLLDTIKGADLGGDGDRLVVDLNFAYHPSCTYDPRWTCPLAPEGNRLTAPVAAGEQLPPGGWY